MKSKKILILALIISSTVGLLGCSNSSSQEVSSKEKQVAESNTSDKNNNSTETAKIEESKANTDKTPAASPDKKSTSSSKNTNSNSNKNATSSSSSNTNSDNNKQENTTSLNYKSKLGFSITFPPNWKNRYKIKEDDNSMYVYFKSTDPNTRDSLGLFFFLKKNYTQRDDDFSDSVLSDRRKYITVGNTTYLVGGPTDVNLNEDNKDFQLFLSMKKEREQVINTIKP